MRLSYRTLCVRAIALMDLMKYGPQDDLMNEIISDFNRLDEREYSKRPADEFTRQYTEEKTP